MNKIIVEIKNQEITEIGNCVTSVYIKGNNNDL